MDLRIVKTRRVIRDAFLELRRKMPLERVRVKEICDLALINKTTFYKHYHDIFALSENLENETMERFLEAFSAKDCLFSNPRRFISEMPAALNAVRETLFPLYHDRFDAFFNKLEDELIRYYSVIVMPGEDEIRLTFVIGGTLHALRKLKFSQKYDDRLLSDRIAKLIEGETGPYFTAVSP